MTDSIIHFQFIVVVQYLIPLLLSFMIVPNQEKYRYTLGLIPAAIFIASGKYVSTSNTPSKSPLLILLTSDVPNTGHAIMRGKHGCTV